MTNCLNKKVFALFDFVLVESYLKKSIKRGDGIKKINLRRKVMGFMKGVGGKVDESQKL